MTNQIPPATLCIPSAPLSMSSNITMVNNSGLSPLDSTEDITLQEAENALDSLSEIDDLYLWEDPTLVEETNTTISPSSSLISSATPMNKISENDKNGK